MFNKKDTPKASTTATTEIKKAAWGYFSIDQLGPKRFKTVEEVVKAMEEGQKLFPLVLWSDGEVSYGTDNAEIWANPSDQINYIPPKTVTRINEDSTKKPILCD